MSCDGWSVGDRCQALVALQAREHQFGGPDRVTTIGAGQEGEVTAIYNDRHDHLMYVLWDFIRRSLPPEHEQIHRLKRIQEMEL